jgi:hypothetical protein
MFHYDRRDYPDSGERDDGIYESRWGESPRDRLERNPDRDPDARERDPRDPFLDALDLPRGVERELVQHERERLYELNGNDSRMLATIGAFRVVRERETKDFRDAEDSLDHLRDQGLIHSVQMTHTSAPIP